MGAGDAARSAFPSDQPPPPRQPLTGSAGDTGGTVRRVPPALRPLPLALPRRRRTRVGSTAAPPSDPIGGLVSPPAAATAGTTGRQHRSSRRAAGPARGPGRDTAGTAALKGTARGGGGPHPPAHDPCPSRPTAARRRHPARPPARRSTRAGTAAASPFSTEAHRGGHPPSPRPDLTGRTRRRRPPGRTPLPAGLPLPYAAPQPASLLRPQPHQPPRRPAAAPASPERSPGTGGARPLRLTTPSSQSPPAQHRRGGKV